MKSQPKGFTLLELMIVITIITIVATMAIPIFIKNKIVTNETAAIVNVKRFAKAQTTLKSSVAMDVNADSEGEYGNFADLTGRNPAFPFDPSFLEEYYETE